MLDVSICRVAISPVHMVPHDSSFILADQAHPLFPRYQQRYAAMLKNGENTYDKDLWLVIRCNNLSKDYNRVVRSWAKRRVKSAIIQQLESNGFDARGHKITNPTVQSNAHNRTPQGLAGIGEFTVLEQIIQVDYMEVLRQANIVVQEILRVCGFPSERTPGIKIGGKVRKSQTGKQET